MVIPVLLLVCNGDISILCILNSSGKNILVANEDERRSVYFNA
jgi:hypothetical protein